MDAEIWRTRAACIGVDVRVFYPKYGDDLGAALAICGRCPVREPCLADALATENADALAYVIGVRGGMTADARRELLRARRAA